MELNKVVPDVVDTLPKHTIKIEYSSGVSVNNGNELTPLSVKDEPIVQWPTKVGAYYTLVMTDPDVPKPISQIKHWLVVNIPANDLTKGETLAGYRGSGPPLNELHRFIFLAYKQTGHLKHTETPVPSDSREGWLKFKVRDFANQYNLGQPYAGNLYLAKGDDYSEEKRAQRMKELSPKELEMLQGKK